MGSVPRFLFFGTPSPRLAAHFKGARDAATGQILGSLAYTRLDDATMASVAPKTGGNGAAKHGQPTEARVLLVVGVNVVLYALCYQLQRPIEPYLVDRLGADRPGSDAAANYARLQSFFSLVQTVGSPLVGYLLDVVGSRNAFAAVFIASAASYELLARCETMEGLYASKIPTVLQHGFLVAQAVVAQSVPPERRAAALGRLMSCYTVGAMIGPALGGHLGAKGDFRLGARLAALGSLASVVLILTLLPSSDSDDDSDDAAHKADEAAAKCEQKKKKHPRGNYRHILAATWPQICTKAAMGVVASTYQTVSPIVLKEKFGVDPAVMGSTMAVQAGVNAAVGGLAMGPITAAFGNDDLVQLCLGFIGFGCVSLITAAQNPSYLPWVTIGTFLSVAGHTLATVLTSIGTSRVGPHEKGTLLGVEHGVFSGVRIASPAFGMALFKEGGVAAVSLACVGIAWGTYVSYGFVVGDKQTDKKKEE